MVSLLKRKKLMIAILFMMMSSLLSTPTQQSHVWLGWNIERKLQDPTYLSERGAPGKKRKVFPRVTPIRVWSNLKFRKADSQMQRLTRMTIAEFKALLHNISYLLLNRTLNK